MLSENLVYFRNKFNYSQEYVAEQVNVSRTAYSKWEKGDIIPDVEKCSILANLYRISLERLFYDENEAESNEIKTQLSSGGKYIFGKIILNKDGGFSVPKDAVKLFSLKPGDKLLVLLNEKYPGIYIVKEDMFNNKLLQNNN